MSLHRSLHCRNLSSELGATVQDPGEELKEGLGIRDLGLGIRFRVWGLDFKERGRNRV